MLGFRNIARISAKPTFFDLRICDLTGLENRCNALINMCLMQNTAWWPIPDKRRIETRVG